MDPDIDRHRTVPLTRLRASIGSIVDDVRDGAPIVVMRRGEPAAVIVSSADFKGSVGMAGRVRKAADLLALVDRARSRSAAPLSAARSALTLARGCVEARGKAAGAGRGSTSTHAR